MRCRVGGRVQMVGFRFFAQQHAQRLSLRGWVRNTGSGEVEVVAEGEAGELEEFLGLLRRGPESAQVTEVRVTELPPDAGLPLGFEVVS